MKESIRVVNGAGCEKRSGIHCWHRETNLEASGTYEEIHETCCWCGTEIHYRGPSLRGHGPFMKKVGT